jgi:hypothetical protein
LTFFSSSLYYFHFVMASMALRDTHGYIHTMYSISYYITTNIITTT